MERGRRSRLSLRAFSNVQAATLRADLSLVATCAACCRTSLAAKTSARSGGNGKESGASGVPKWSAMARLSGRRRTTGRRTPRISGSIVDQSRVMKGRRRLQISARIPEMTTSYTREILCNCASNTRSRYTGRDCWWTMKEKNGGRTQKTRKSLIQSITAILVST
jgi:hypothetical protein